MKPLTQAVAGGSHGGGAVLSGMGRQVVDAYHTMLQRADAAVAKEHQALQSLLAPEVHDLNLSARNTLTGKVQSIEFGEIMAKVKFALPDGQIMTALVTRESVTDIKLRKGAKLKAVIKASKIILAKDM